MLHTRGLKILGLFISIMFITACSTTPNFSELKGSRPISQDTRNAIAICSGKYENSNAGKLEAKFLKSGANAEMILKQLEGGGPMYKESLGDTAAVDMYKEYVKCINAQQSRQSKTNDTNSEESQSTTFQKATKSLHGIEYTFNGCNREGGNELTCNFMLASKFRDRVLDIYLGEVRIDNINGTRVFDNYGEMYRANEVILSNKGGKHSRYSVWGIDLIADVPVTMTIKFTNLSTRANEIKKFELSVRTRLDRNWENGILEFRNIPI